MDEAELIDWTDARSHVLLNPRMRSEEREVLERSVPDLPGHIFVATSGTTGFMRMVALSKDAVLASAAAVNDRLQARTIDVWCCVLPTFHVGGIGIYARAHLSGSRVVAMPWDVNAFASSDATLASLVPAQVYDLVRAKVKAPARFRVVLVGSGTFAPDLQKEARALGWPVLASYGMSECASTVAVEEVLLPHMNARQEADGRVALSGSSLLTGYALPDGSFLDPKVDGWLITEDFGDVDGRHLRIRGRAGDFVKVGGESVDLLRLDRILDSLRGAADMGIVAVPEPRLGYVVHLVATEDASAIVEAFNERVLPFERIQAVHQVESIPRSALGKLLRTQIVALLQS